MIKGEGNLSFKFEIKENFCYNINRNERRKIMTFIKKIKFHNIELYRVYEYGSFGVRIRDCTLDEVMYILSTKEKK
jgi:hypothetical protein